MLAFQESQKNLVQSTLNVLPCRVGYNGPVNASTRYWAPTVTEDNKPVAYFRGRELHGKSVSIPEGYRGVVASSTNEKLPKENDAHDKPELDGEEQEYEVHVVEQQAEFNKVLIWGHEALPDETEDPYIRGIQEWVAFAEQMHSHLSVGDNNQA